MAATELDPHQLMTINPRIKSYLLRGSLVLLVAVGAWAGWSAFKVWRAWENVERIAFDPGGAREILAEPGNLALEDPGASPTDDTTPATANGGDDDPTTSGIPNDDIILPEVTPLAPDATQTFLVIGSDQREETGPSSRADVILMVILPAGGDDPVMVSIPRDLYIPNPCTGGKSRINANLNGCGDRVSGPDLLAIAVEDFTGVQIDHFAVFDFEGFKQIVDRVGGVEICVEHQVRDRKTRPPLDLPAGCAVADGEMTLSWVRSRKTQELVDGVWRPMVGVNDLTRNQHQQELLLEALRRLKDFRSITEFAGLVEDVAGAFAIDTGLSLGDAIGLTWDLRSLNPADILRPVIPVADYLAPGGAEVLIPQATFLEVLQSVWPEAGEVLATD